MKSLVQPYLRARHPELVQGNDLVIQTKYPQLVGVVCMFKNQAIGEERRRKFLASIKKNCLVGKAKGFRVYVKLYATLETIHEEINEDWEALVHTTMAEMADFYAQTLPDGMKRQYEELEE